MNESWPSESDPTGSLAQRIDALCAEYRAALDSGFAVDPRPSISAFFAAALPAGPVARAPSGAESSPATRAADPSASMDAVDADGPLCPTASHLPRQWAQFVDQLPVGLHSLAEIAALRSQLLAAVTERLYGALLEDDASGVGTRRSLAEGELPANRQIGRYHLRGLLGEGAFGRVWLAYDEQLQRRVAIKVPTPARFRGPSDAEAYLREARTLARLDHPHIVPIYDTGRADDGSVYLVSKYIDGPDLAARLAEGPLPFAVIARWLAALAEALHHAHASGIIHRDIKPGNVLLDRRDETPFLTDFGLAIREEDYVGESHVAGTPAYMSPEQARGEGHRLDGRSDVFSLGVVMYQLLAGRRPFVGATAFEVMHRVIACNPAPPRAVRDEVPAELERICLKALAKQSSQRYGTAEEFARDLRRWQEPVSIAVPPRSALPKGLRAYDADDAETFLDLLPGPRHREGLPESLRLWKVRLEQRDPDATFRVGLIYGPSGCGKSSIVRAGLLPRLADFVLPIYVEATAGETETRILQRLRKRLPDLPDCDALPQIFAALRRSACEGRKVVVVLDQFEQWLHAHRSLTDTELAQALRQCDGGRLQALLLVRDDFAMAMSRFMRELDVRLVEGHNFGAIDLFDLDHARKVLATFGRGLGRLPNAAESLPPAQEQFLDAAVAGLAQDGKIVPIRLAIFAEMAKRKPWLPATLERIGGAEGIGVNFLEEAFYGRQANPQHRAHHAAARQLLERLLPDIGSDIKGNMRSVADLGSACGYAEQTEALHDLLQILDGDLRLITPTDPAGADSRSAHDLQGEYYQLTHDFLVPALREWLTRKRRETPRGRAELLLQERASLWAIKEDPRQLPSWKEFLRIRLRTPCRDWNEAQARMMARAAEHHARQLAQQLARATPADAPRWCARLRQLPDTAPAALRKQLATAEDRSDGRLNLAIALLADDAHQLDYVLDCLPEASARHTQLIRDALAPVAARAVPRLWTLAEQADGGSLLRYAAPLAAYAPDAQDWERVAPRIATALTTIDPQWAAFWRDMLLPAAPRLVPALKELFRDRSRGELALSLAAQAVAAYCADDVPTLAELACDATPQQFAELFPRLSERRDATVVALQEILAATDERPHDGSALVELEPCAGPAAELLVQAGGRIAQDWAYGLALAPRDLDQVVEGLTPYGYRLASLAPYQASGRPRVAALWTRDGVDTAYLLAAESGPLLERDRQLAAAGWHGQDCGLARLADGSALWSAVWRQTPMLPELSDGRVCVAGGAAGLPDEHLDARDCLRLGASPGLEPLAAVLRPAQTHLGRPRYACGSLADFRDDLYPDWLLVDLRIQAGTTATGETEPCFTGIWTPSPAWESRGAALESAEALDARLRQLAGEGFRPAALRAVQVNGKLYTAAVAHRPLPSLAHQEEAAQRRATACAALLRLNASDAAWPALQWTSDPRLRSYLIHRLRPYGVPLQSLTRRLFVETDPSARRALTLAVGEYPPHSWEQTTLAAVVEELAYALRTSGDPGLRSAAQWSLERLGQSDMVQRLAAASRSTEVRPDRAWYVNRSGQTFAVVRGPVEFRMGSPPQEQGREGGPYSEAETRHRRIIAYSYAISTTVVTVGEFLEFCPAFSYRAAYAPTPDCPINQVSFYDAVAYCNWLSQREGIPQDQWCYLPNARGEYGDGMVVPADFLARSGYRLPTESEWEYASRAGARTSRYYGESDALDAHYAWAARNSECRWSAPVGRLKPNDLGLFDALGNIIEWCHPVVYPAGLAVDRLQADRPLTLGDNDQGIARGAHFANGLSQVRCSYASRFRVNFFLWATGFRLARTVGDEASGLAVDQIVTDGDRQAWRSASLLQHWQTVRCSWRSMHNPNALSYGNGMRVARTLLETR